MALIHVTESVGLTIIPAIISAFGAITAAYIGRKNLRSIQEVKEVAHQVNASVNNVGANEPTLREAVTEIKENQADVKKTLEEKDGSGT